MYIFPEALEADAFDAAVERATQEIVKLGGEVESVTRLGKRTFARPMHKQGAGQYVVVICRLPGEHIKTLHERYALDPQVFRAQFVRAGEKPPEEPAPSESEAAPEPEPEAAEPPSAPAGSS
jgi:ribosomal protein S6